MRFSLVGSGTVLFAAVLLTTHPAFAAKTVNVTDVATLTAAINAAAPDDEIVLAAGTYHFTQSPNCGAAATTAAPVIVRSATPLAAKIEFDALEGFRVTGPNWHFEGLDVRGVCANDTDCEHAFHVTGKATGFVLRGSRVADFNAQLKVNADKAGGATFVQPNNGLVENNEVFDTHARATSNPVTKLNIDTVDGWIVRGNFIHDAHKNGGDNVSYQTFMKGGGKNGLYERNLIVCTKDDTTGGTRIGLSFGGGGTGAQFCAPAFDANTPCNTEMTGSTMKNNIIANCSDVGIYLNKSTDSHILYNTLIATSGVDFRFATSSGEADGNVLASKIRTRDGATMTLKTNIMDLTDTDFNAYYVAPLIGDLKKKGDLSNLLGKGAARADVADDYCARARNPGAMFDMGALQASLGDCVTTTPPVGSSSGSGNDGGVTPNDGGGSSGSSGGGASSSGSTSGATPGEQYAAPAADDDGGCGCDVIGQRRSFLSVFGIGAISALSLLVLRRRKRY